MSGRPLGQRRDFRALFDQLDGVALWTVDSPGEFDYISAGFEDIWGFPPEEVEDDVTRLVEAIHPEDRERVRKNIDSSAGEHHDEAYEGHVVQPDGSVRWVSRGKCFSATTTEPSRRSSVSVRTSQSRSTGRRNSNC